MLQAAQLINQLRMIGDAEGPPYATAGCPWAGDTQSRRPQAACCFLAALLDTLKWTFLSWGRW